MLLDVIQDGGHGADTCNKHDLKDLVKLICLGHVSVHGLDRPGMNVNEKKSCILVV